MDLRELTFKTATDVNLDFVQQMELLTNDYHTGDIGENRFTKLTCVLMDIRLERLDKLKSD